MRLCRLSGRYLPVMIVIILLYSKVAFTQANNKSQAPAMMIPAGGSGGATDMPDLFTGALSHVIPIDVLPGRKGMDPGLALTYNNHNGNGVAGVGWDLDAGAIELNTKAGVTYPGDRFVVRMAGSTSELIPWSGGYRAKFEGEFTRFQKIGSHWVATDKTGTRYFFGQSNNTRQFNPQNINEVFRWALDYVLDRNGNYMRFTYIKDQEQIYLDRIDYTGNEITQLGTTNYVKFHYESRSDAPAMYTANFSVITAKRLKTIEVRANGNLVRAYKLKYRSSLSASTRRSLLESVQQYGKDAQLSTQGDITNPTPSALPATTLAYSQDSSFASFSDGSHWKENWCAGGGALFGTGDFDGNGMLDIWCHERAIRQSSNNSMVEREWATATSVPGWGGADFSWSGDFNGDGLSDIATANGGNMWVKLSTGSGFENRLWTSSASNWNGSSNAWVGDFNGDGLTDIAVRNAGRMWLKRSSGSSFEEVDWGAEGSWGTPGHSWAGDFNGDGLQDIVTGASSDMWVKLSTGSGFTESQWVTGTSLHWNGTARAWAADFTGDGLTDVAVYDKNTDKMWVKRSNGFKLSTPNGTLPGFVEEDWGTFEDHGEGDGFRWIGDFNGDGLLDIALANGGNMWVRHSTGSATSGFVETQWATNAPLHWDGPENAWAADFNGDGLTDVLTYDRPSSKMWLKRSTGSSFEEVEWGNDVDTWESSGYRWVGDFNGDRLPDIVIRNSGLWVKESFPGTVGGNTRIALSNGNGAFVNATPNGNPWKSDWCKEHGKIFGTGDFNADGKTDIFCHDTHPDSNGDTFVALSSYSNGVGSFTGGTIPWKSNWCKEAGTLFGAGDFNGDGRTDLYCHYPQIDPFAPSSTPGFSAGSTKIAISNGQNGFMDGSDWLPNWCGEAGRAFGVGDFNGDGKTDFFCSNTHPQTGGNTQIALATISSSGVGSFALGSTMATTWCKRAGVKVGTGDFNGDGKTDFYCHWTAANINTLTFTYIALSSGAGQLASATFWQLDYCKQIGFMLGTGDFNGDGKTDFFCHSPQNNTAAETEVFLSDGMFLSEGSDWRPEWCGHAGAMFGAGDFNGDGKTDIFCHDLVPSSEGKTWVARSGSGVLDGLTDLLTSISDGTGGTSTIAYTPSTRFTNTRLPFPIQLVSSVTTSDGTISATTEFFYQDGFFYLQERDSRGFGYVKVTGPLGPDNEQSIAETWFHQGNGGNADVEIGYLKGKPYHTRVTNRQGATLSETFTTYVADDQEPYFNPPERVDTSICDGDTCTIKTRISFAYDAYGNVIRERQYGEFNDDPSLNNTSDDRTVVRTFTGNESEWIVGLTVSEIIYQGIDTLNQIAKVNFFYDSVDCATPSISPYPPKGNLTCTTRWVSDGPQPWNNTGTTIENKMTSDSYGNLISSRDANGNVTTFSYDTASSTFLTALTRPSVNGVQFQTITRYYGVGTDPADNGLYGQVKSVQEPNGAVSTTQYDPLGRKVKVISPGGDGTPAGNVTTWSYNNIGTLNSQHIQTTNVATGLFSSTYFDGFGRTILEKKSGPNGQIIVTQTMYNNTGTVKQTSFPYVEGGSPLWRTFVYDALDRVTQATNPDGSRVLSCYNDGVTVTIDASNHRARATRDGNGRLVRVDEYMGTYTTCTTDLLTPYATTFYQYDVLGNLRFVTDAKGNQTEIRYDTLGRKVFMHDPDMGNWSYFYDANGNLIKQVDAKGTQLELTYDALNRVLTKAVYDAIVPSAPGSLTASSISGTQINLSWIASSDNIAVAGYRVERCQGAGCSNFVERVAVTTNSYSDTELTAGTSYSYRVRANDAIGNLSSYSNVATASASNPFNLTVNKSGTGAGTVTSTPAGINCGATCSGSFNSGTSVTLTAAANTGSTFTGFSGGCASATTTCTFTITANTTVTATFNGASTNTGLKAPTANAAETVSAGDNNGYQSSPGNVTALEGLFAIDTNSGNGTGTSCTGTDKDKHRYYNYDFSIPSGSTIRGITVLLDARVENTAGTPKICVQISWDGGTTWTTAKETSTLAVPVQAYTLGGATDTWGRSWSVNDFTNTNFRVRVINVSSDITRDFLLDRLAVQVDY